MSSNFRADCASAAWLWLITSVVELGERVAPRGKPTREIPQFNVELDMRRPVMKVPERKLGYKFMAAEAHWMLAGKDDVESVAPYSSRIAQFSDDGKTFFGAYGPRIKEQLPYVVMKLAKDQSSRQAGLTTWRPNPPETKDVPCTVAMFFSIRKERMNLHVFMRSNDVWLGTPYDAFNFSMVAHLACCRYNSIVVPRVSPGTLYLTAASSHMYEENVTEAQAVLDAHKGFVYGREDLGIDQPETPEELWTNEEKLMARLAQLRNTSPRDPLRWWEVLR